MLTRQCLLLSLHSDLGPNNNIRVNKPVTTFLLLAVSEKLLTTECFEVNKLQAVGRLVCITLS